MAKKSINFKHKITNIFQKVTAGDIGSLLIFVGALPALVVYLTWYVADHSKLTAMESGLLQAISILAGMATSHYFAKVSAKNMVRERAKLALRRISTLYAFFPGHIQSITYKKSLLDSSTKNDKVDARLVEMAINDLIIETNGQIRSVNDAVEDWRELVPDAEEIVQAYREEAQ